MYWKNFNRRAARWASRVTDITGYPLFPDRPIFDNQDYAIDVAGGVIALGGEKVYESFREIVEPGLIQCIDNAVMPAEKVPSHSQRGGFLFFSGAGPVHKGLGLILDALAYTDLPLYICQELTTEFKHAFVYHLQAPNVHYVGIIPRRGEKFYELCSKCAFVISASCSEGQPSAVLECMAHGLFPVATKECGIKEAAIIGMHNIYDTCHNILERDPREVAAFTKNKYSPEKFIENFTKALETLEEA